MRMQPAVAVEEVAPQLVVATYGVTPRAAHRGHLHAHPTRNPHVRARTACIVVPWHIVTARDAANFNKPQAPSRTVASWPGVERRLKQAVSTSCPSSSSLQPTACSTASTASSAAAAGAADVGGPEARTTTDRLDDAPEGLTGALRSRGPKPLSGCGGGPFPLS